VVPSGDIYNSARLAAGYAFSRPPVHPRVVQRIAAHHGLRGRRLLRALDVGCGAGQSTAALAAIAGSVVGLERAEAMLVHCRAVAPGATFVVGQAEHLPFPDGSFDLVTAAGSLNYTDRDRSLAEIARVLASTGVLAIYDFSSGRRCRDAATLDAWFAAFEERYPFPPGYAMDVQALDYARSGLRLAAYEPFEVAVPLTREAYLAYVLSEANVERAIASGVPEADIVTWSRRTLAPVFGLSRLAVLFSGYIAYVIPAVTPSPGPVARWSADA
jgi:SAM-dependent methyltransferase